MHLCSCSFYLVLLVVAMFWYHVPSVMALFEECNHRINLNVGEKVYINSPYYPGKYPVGSSCRYTVQAPVDYELQFKCKIDLSAVPFSSRCINEIFYFNREGSELLSGSEYFCGKGHIERKSFLNRAVISYMSTPYGTPSSSSSSSIFAKTTMPELIQSKNELTKEDTKQQVTPESEVSTEANTNRTDIRADTKETTKTTPATTAQTPIPTLAQTPPPTPPALHTLTRKPTVRPTSALDFLLAALTWRKNFSSSSFGLSPPWTNATTQPASASASSLHKARIIDRNSAIFSTAAGVGGGSFSCLVEVLAPPCDCGWSISTKVAGSSTEAGIYEFPSMAGVLTLRDSKIFCGAAIIHHRFLISAAHCFTGRGRDSAEYIGVVVGENDFSTVFESLLTRSYQIEAIIRHENFRSTAETVRNDIALLRTRIPIEWNRSVGPTCLPFRSVSAGTNSVRKPPIAGQRLDVAGWGTTSFGGPQSTRLLKTTLDVITRDACKRSVPFLESNTFCTFTPGRDACQYDSGGALYARENRLFAVGIVSYGFGCATGQPSVNTRVAAYVKWIQTKTPEVQYCVK